MLTLGLDARRHLSALAVRAQFQALRQFAGYGMNVRLRHRQNCFHASAQAPANYIFFHLDGQLIKELLQISQAADVYLIRHHQLRLPFLFSIVHD